MTEEEEGHHQGETQWEEVAGDPARTAEATQISAGYDGPTGDPEVPEVHRAPPQKAAIPEVGKGTCPRPRQDGH